jgi:hypothetical protein
MDLKAEKTKRDARIRAKEEKIKNEVGVNAPSEEVKEEVKQEEAK